MPEKVKAFLSRPLFQVDGFTLTVGLALVAMLIFYIYLKRR